MSVRRRSALATAALVAACGGDGAGPIVATQLDFVSPPAAVLEGEGFAEPIRVRVMDDAGRLATSGSPIVTLALEAGAPDDALQGTTSATALNGIATFDDVRVAADGQSYRLTASSPGLEDAASDPFDVHVRFASISAGGVHSCGLREDGEALCWGDNGTGRLGTGGDVSSAFPVPIATLRFASLDAGAPLTCGVTDEGEGYCWGQLVPGDIYQYSPTPLSGGHTFASIAAVWHSCGLTSVDEPYCWGANESRQLGADYEGYASTEPLRVALGGSILDIAPGGAHTCALTALGEAYCWGNNPEGQVGNGTREFQSVPVAVATTERFVDIEAGNDHTCALTAAGQVWCWGSNAELQLGQTGIQRSAAPVQVSGGRTFVQLSVGGASNCGLEADGTAWCWGRNTFGILGDGTQVNRSSPVQVKGGLLFAQISAGGWHSCGLTPAGEAYCWGDGTNGALGTGDAGALTPNRVRPRVRD